MLARHQRTPHTQTSTVPATSMAASPCRLDPGSGIVLLWRGLITLNFLSIQATKHILSTYSVLVRPEESDGSGWGPALQGQHGAGC